MPRDPYLDPVLETYESLDDSAKFHFFLEKVTLLRCISPDFREGGSEQIREGARVPKNRQQMMLSGFCLY